MCSGTGLFRDGFVQGQVFTHSILPSLVEEDIEEVLVPVPE